MNHVKCHVGKGTKNKYKSLVKYFNYVPLASTGNNNKSIREKPTEAK
jgi:hypothetical protein